MVAVAVAMHEAETLGSMARFGVMVISAEAAAEGVAAADGEDTLRSRISKAMEAAQVLRCVPLGFCF